MGMLWRLPGTPGAVLWDANPSLHHWLHLETSALMLQTWQELRQQARYLCSITSKKRTITREIAYAIFTPLTLLPHDGKCYGFVIRGRGACFGPPRRCRLAACLCSTTQVTKDRDGATPRRRGSFSPH